MTRDQILEYCRKAAPVGKVLHEEFADYVITLQQRKRVDDSWTNVEHPYMTVDGRLAMANEDHRRQAKRLDFDLPQVLVDNEDQLTLMVTVTSEIYGTRHGIATSRRLSGTEAERQFPWEVAETSAIGRALAAMGYGLFPGSGLASAEDMLRATANSAPERRAPVEAERPGRSAPVSSAQRVGVPETAQGGGRNADGRDHTYNTRPPTPLSPVQRRKLVELYRNLNGGSEADTLAALDRLFNDAFRHGMSEATYDEGTRITAQLLAELRTRAG